MNKIFKVIWNPATGNYTVTSETAKSRGKKSGRSKLLISALVAGGMLSSSGTYAEVSLDGGTSAESTPLSDTWIAIGKGAVASSDPILAGTNAASIAIGVQAISGVGSTSLGYKARSTGDKSVALGQLANASGSRGIAIGSAAEATNEHTIAMGLVATASGENAVAIGDHTEATGKNSLTMGYYSKALGEDSLAFGRNVLAGGTGSIAMGAESEATGDTSIAMGQHSNASKVNSIALGSNSAAVGDNAVALGESSSAGGKNSLAFGNQANANGDNSIALGAGSVASTDNTVSVGNGTTQRKIVNMGAGEISTNSTEAINGSQLYTISQSVANRLGGGSDVNANGTINAPSYKLKSGTYNNVGEALFGIDNDTLHWDKNKTAFSASYIIRNADGTIKSTVVQNKIINVADGDISATSTDAINGSQLKATKDDVAANTASITDLSADVAGNTTNITNLTNDVADNTTNITNLTDAVDSLGDDSLLWDGTAFSAKHGTNATSKITNVADGSLAAGSTDAVNGSQLKATKDDVAANTTSITNLTNDVADNTTNITNLTNDVADNTTNITNLTDAVDSLGDDSLLWDGTAFSAKHGTNATSKITNVADGSLAAGSTDAVNGSQLKATKDDVAANTTNITNLTNDVAGNTTSITNLTNDVADNTTNITNLTDAVDSLGDDSLLWDGTAFSAAHGTDATSKITNVTAGAISATSTDAVNGGQLYGLSSTVADYFGGGAAVSDTGVFTGPTYSINGTDYNSVGDALAAINTSVGTSLGDALLWDNTAGNFSASHGGNASKIANVAAGTLSATSTDAVNGSQLFGISGSVADALGGGSTVNTDGTISAPTYTIANTDYSSISDALGAIDATLDDSLLWDNASGSFSASHGGSASKIAYVAAGEISATSTDAINGSQLNTTNENVAANTTNISNLTTDVATNTTNITNLTDAIDSLGEDAMQWDSVSGSFSAAHGTDTASKITNVAAGELSAASTDAVNGSQLYAANMLINQNSEIINQLAGNTNSTYIEENGAGINYVRTNDTGLTFVDASAAGVGSTAVGYNSVASGESSVAIGQNSSSTIDSGIALGSNSVSNRVILKGSRSTSVTEDGVVIGYDTTDGELLGALSIGDDGKYRQIINVADGSEAHDAVTVR
ncbi:adhesin, partial [Escherichia coli]|nr:adhesin [Escherichia coli]